MLWAAQVFLETWKVGHTLVESLQLGIRGVCLVSAKVVGVLDVLKQNEICNYRLVSSEEDGFFVDEVSNYGQIFHAFDGDASLVRLLEEVESIIVADALELVSSGLLLRRVSKQIWAVFCRDVLVDRIRLRNLEITINEIRQIA